MPLLKASSVFSSLTDSSWQPPKHAYSPYLSNLLSQPPLAYSTLATVASLLFLEPTRYCPCTRNTAHAALSVQMLFPQISARLRFFALLTSLLKATSSGSSSLTILPQLESFPITQSLTLLYFPHYTYCLGCYITNLLIYWLIYCLPI